MSLTDDDKHWIRTELERIETSLLSEFHQWASPLQARQHSHTAALRALDMEMEPVADRGKKLEA